MIRPLVARKRQASKNQVATEKAGWFRKSMKFFLGIPLLAICGLLINYKYHESEDLRNNLYRPLYTELSKIENDIQQDGMMLSFQTTTKASLEEKGELNRLPIALRTKVQTAYTDAASLLGNMSIIEAVQRATSIEAAKIRTKAIDEEWTHRTVAKMNKEALAKPGASIIAVSLSLILEPLPALTLA